MSAAPAEPPVLVASVTVESAAPAFVGAPTGAVKAECPARDPESGACYASADAADRAWLRRPVSPASARAEDEEDPDEEAPAADAAAEKLSPAQLAFWKNLANTVKNLVVRKANSRPASLPEEEIAGLLATDFPIPLAAFDRAKFRDTFFAKRGRQKKHHAIDLPAPRGTPVLAVTDGVIERLGRDRRGGKVVYLRDNSGHYTFFYAHLAKHEKGLKAGDHVVKGQRLGDVGATGHVIGGPHLHFAIFRDEDAASGGRALVVNPYLIFTPLLTAR
ncbi:MAG TPA: M23 family metallopeptidase [Thermoanaerobaculia bacterium]|nr:M23 family metallopeptidase [Thermoanaerobaculia bacterium]